MAKIEILKSSNAWSTEHNLPTFPTTNNGWLYLAYASKLLDQESINSMHSDVYALFRKNLIKPGLYKRIDSDIDVSQDELIGMVYCSLIFNLDTSGPILHRLLDYKWCYDIKSDKFSFKRWVYRFNDIPAIIKAYASREFLGQYLARSKINILDKIRFSIAVILRAISKDQGMSDHLMTWIVSDEMSKYRICKWAINFWKRQMNKRNITVSSMMREYFSGIPQMEFLALCYEGNDLNVT